MSISAPMRICAVCQVLIEACDLDAHGTGSREMFAFAVATGSVPAVRVIVDALLTPPAAS